MHNPTHTVAFNTAEPTSTFDDMEKLVRELNRKPILKEIRIHPSAYLVLRTWLDEVRARRVVTLSDLDRVQTFGVYGTPILIDNSLKRGQWQAIDTEEKVMEERNLLEQRA